MNRTDSIIFYLLIIILSSLFAYFSQIKKEGTKYSTNKKQTNERKNYNILMIIISYIILTLPIALKYNTGADYTSYMNIYGNVQMYGMNASSVTNTEIGFILLNYLCFKIFKDFQSVIIIAAVITNYFMYKAILYESKYINLGLAIFTYGFTLYFLEYSIIRNMLGISIGFYALRFIFERKPVKYFIFITIAVLFHNSLIIFYMIGILYTEKLKKYRLHIGIISIILIPFIPNIINYSVKYALMLSPNYSFYLKNINMSSFSYGISFLVYSLPLIPFMTFYKKMKVININLSLYFSLYIVSSVILLISYSNPIMMRLVYALWTSQIILFPLLFSALGKINGIYKKTILYGISLSGFVIYGIIIILNIINTELWYMIPYKSILQKYF